MNLSSSALSTVVSSLIVLIVLICVDYSLQQEQETCNQDRLDRSFVTQCQVNICEPVIEFKENSDSNKVNQPPSANDWPTTKDEVIHIVSTRKGDRFKINKYKSEFRNDFYYEESHVNGTIFVDTKMKYQKILGFGTTLTDASCINIDELPDQIREKLINDYFNPDTGIGLNLIKIPIGSTKYSYSNYVLDEPDGNLLELSPYDLNHRISLIKDAMKSAGKFKNRIKLLASSTTAPSDYKDNNKLIHGGSLKQDSIIDYASYLTSFIAAYKTQGLNIWSLILSEQPVSISQDLNGPKDSIDYNSMAMKPSEAAKLIKAINQVRTTRIDVDRFRLMLLGDNRAFIPVWVDTIFKSKDLADSVAGVAYTCDNNNKFSPYDNLYYVAKRYPNKYLLASQGSINSPIKLGNWQYAENYGTEIVKNLEFGSVGWIDFNLALNLNGGPCINDKFKADSSVIVDSKLGAYYRNPMFYAIGHLSRYVKPGSIRVKSVHHYGAHMFANQHIAFITPDNYLIVFVMNNNIGPMPISIGIDTITKVQSLLETKSFNTFIFKL